MGDVDELVCLGDSIYEYRFSNEVVRILKEREAQVIVGNHEEVFFGPLGVRARARDGIDPELAAWLASRPHASPLASALILGVYGLGSAICHQLPERSFHLWTAQMPVCARCAGIYFGAVAGAAFALRASASLRRRDTWAARPRALLSLAVTPTVITLVYEWTTGVMPSHAIRAAAGEIIRTEKLCVAIAVEAVYYTTDFTAVASHPYGVSAK
jgi:uncharacterized membrane protein